MLKFNRSEAISSAVEHISAIPELEDLDVSSVKLAVVLRLLNAAGSDVFDISQVVPDYPTGNGRVDFVLMGSPRRGVAVLATPRVLVEVKPFGENIDGARFERRMLAQCARTGAPLAVLTNGRR